MINREKTGDNAVNDGDRGPDEEEDDEYVKMIKGTGCYEQHIVLHECYFDSKDWRKCRKELEEFKKCIQSNQKQT